MTVPSISVIIPALNAEAFIREALLSVQAQTLAISEIIVIDNGCHDKTPQIARRMGAKVIREEKRGISAARNAGIRISKGEWVALIDADDEWDERKTERQWSLIEACPEAGLVSCDFSLMKDGVLVQQTTQEQRLERWQGYEGRVVVGEHGSYIPEIKSDLFPRFFPSPSTVMLRREVFERVGLFDEDVLYSEDFEYFMRVFARFPLAVVELPLVRHRLHAGKHSLHLDEMRKGMFSVVNKMLDQPEKYPAGVPQLFRERLKNSFLRAEQSISTGR
ncbi:MAG TPA: glycosyltransferase family A protein [Pyrinomonadaceae bacterium]|jgi:glycosyltransferase involved in cell wall biosynthesis